MSFIEEFEKAIRSETIEVKDVQNLLSFVNHKVNGSLSVVETLIEQLEFEGVDGENQELCGLAKSSISKLEDALSELESISKN